MKHFLLALAVGLSVTACKNEPSPEDIGNDYLSRARVYRARVYNSKPATMTLRVRKSNGYARRCHGRSMPAKPASC